MSTESGHSRGSSASSDHDMGADMEEEEDERSSDPYFSEPDFRDSDEDDDREYDYSEHSDWDGDMDREEDEDYWDNIDDLDRDEDEPADGEGDLFL